MELELRDGDYVVSGGRARRTEGREALLQRVLFRLTARRGQFPFLEDLGSRLWTLGQLPAGKRQTAAEPGLTVEQVTLEQGTEGRSRLTAELTWNGEDLRVTVDVE